MTQVPARDGRQEPDRRARRRRPQGRGRSRGADGAFFSTGQRCTASSRLIVTEGIHDAFVEAPDRARCKNLRVDDALAKDTDIGPVVDPSQLKQDTGLHRDRPGGRRQAAPSAASSLKRETRATTCSRRCSPRRPTRCASPARRSSGRWPRHPRQGLRRSAGRRQRHRVRPLGRHLHDLAQVRDALQAQLARPAW